MIFIFAMLLCAWIQTHNDNAPAWIYAAVLALGSAVYGIFTGGDLVGFAIMAGMLFLFLCCITFYWIISQKASSLGGPF